MSWEYVAKGVFAIGNAAVGVVSLGLISVRLLALGVCAVGGYAGGVCAVGSKIAVGVAAAAGETAVGYDADAAHVLLCGNDLSRAEVEAFLQAHHPDLWRPLLRLFSALGANIK